MAKTNAKMQKIYTEWMKAVGYKRLVVRVPKEDPTDLNLVVTSNHAIAQAK